MGNKNSFACSFKQDGVDFSEESGSKSSSVPMLQLSCSSDS